MLSRALNKLRSVFPVAPPARPLTINRKPFESRFAALIPRGHRHIGNTGRLQRAMLKAARGETVCFGVIGGSITQGGNATNISLRYADLVAQWWRETFPASNLFYVNCGIGGTGTNYGAHRLAYQLLHHNPDVVLIEFAVNDDDTRHYGETLEGMVRQSLKHASQPATFILSPMKNDGSNAQTFHDPVALHYDVTTLSVRDMLWPEIAADRIKWGDVTDDHIHPSDDGHRALADLVISYLNGVAATLSEDTQPVTDAIVPVPLYADTYEFIAIHTAEPIMAAPAIVPSNNTGWKLAHTSWGEPCLEASVPGAELVVETEGTVIHLLYHRQHGDFGIASLTIDDQPSEHLDAWYAGGGLGIKFCHLAGSQLKPGRHTVRLKLLSDRSDQSTGHRFQLLAVLAAGVKR